MSTTPPEGSGTAQRPDLAPIPAGYKAGDYVPFRDRDPSNPSAIAGRWADPARNVQQGGGGGKMTADERYRAIYGWDAPRRVELASWTRRVLGTLVDGVLSAIVALPLILGLTGLHDELHTMTDAYGRQVVTDTSDVSTFTIGMLVGGGLLVVVFNLYNYVWRQGRTGYTFGKTVLAIRLVRESSREPAGMLSCFVRQFVHYLDSLLCYLGWLWPLWDVKKQTFTDKIMGTVVILQDPDELIR